MNAEGNRLPISYRDFYDLPRAFFVRSPQGWLFFDCVFDPVADAYPSDYTVGLMNDGPDAFPGPWHDVLARATRIVGTVAVSAVPFDETRRATVDTEIFSLLGL